MRPDDEIFPSFPIEPGTPEEEEEAVQRLADFLEISDAGIKHEDAYEAAKELIEQMRVQIKREQLNG